GACRWSRGPGLPTQLFGGMGGIYLLQGHRFDWGAVLVVLAVLGFAALLSAPSVRALTGSRQAPPEREPPASKPPAGQPPASKPPAGQPPARKPAAGKTPARKPPTRRR